MIRMNDQSGVPSYIKFRKGSEVSFDKLNALITNVINPTSEFGYKLIKSENDNLGYINYRYYQTYQSYALQNGMFIVHVKDGKIVSINGDINKQISIANTITLTEDAALQQALTQINASQYKWQVPGEDEHLKKIQNDPKASYYPKGEIELYCDKASQKYYYTYKFDIYASKPLLRAEFYVDASNGNILFKNSKIHFADVEGTAITKYSGTQKITTDSVSPTSFRLRETGRGLGIETYNLLTSTTYTNTDFTDADNYWNNVNTAKDEVATDAHWGAEMTYDFYKLKFNRNSLDGNGLKLLSYVHYDVNYANAFWDGQEMTYGDGSSGSGMGPLTAIDICGHEMTHGVTSFTANLNYQGESGAMNEGFSDIMGIAIKFYAKPATATWQMGPDIGTVIRDMSNPNAYQQPDTYNGTYWYNSTGCTPSANNDECGVHTNSGVINYWYYLLSHGGSGTNDIGNAFNVSALGMDTASSIAYRTLTTYLVPASQYADARFYAIQAATDLYGACSPAVASTTNAMYAVGIGAAFIAGVSSDYTSDLTSFCKTPATVVFSNQSNNCSTYLWDFGDGTNSTDINPTHVYTSYGDFNVKLVSTGGCGSDSITKTAFVSVQPTNPCTYEMPSTGKDVETSCNGILLDNGGSSNYIDNSSSMTTIAPTGATTITLTFTSFNYQAGYDFLSIYDGPDTTSTLIGNFSGTTLPLGGTINSTSGAITLKQRTNAGTTMSGFVLNWQAVVGSSAASCNFKVSDTTSCDGLIDFTDLSANCPSSWLWDFGDGTTDIAKNPTHVYQTNGTFNVKLKVANPFGADSLIKTQLITIYKPLDPSLSFTDTTHCGPTNFFITATKNGEGYLKWFDSPTSTIPIDTNLIFATPLISAPNTYYYVEMQQDKPSLYGGKTDSIGGAFQNYTQNVQRGEVFNCYAEAKLVSVLVWATGAGNRTIELWNSSDNVILSKTVYIPNGKSRVYLNFDLPIENNLKLYGPATPNLARNNGSGTTGNPYFLFPYPYNISNLVSITTTTATTTPNNLYYYFYDWEVKPAPCKSNRVPVHIAISSNIPNSSFTYNQNIGQFTNTSLGQGNTYNWSFGDGGTSTIANPVHLYATNGTYYAKLITTNSCGTDSTIQTIVITNASINESSLLKNFNIYPNPTNHSVNITLTSVTSTDASILIYDLLGNTIYSENITINTTEYNHKVDVSTFGKGIYFISLKSNNTTISKKLIVY